MYNVRVNKWSIRPDAEADAVLAQWAENAKEHVAFRPSRPVYLHGEYTDHPDPSQERGTFIVDTSAIRSIELIRDERILSELGFNAGTDVYMIETASASCCIYFVDISDYAPSAD